MSPSGAAAAATAASESAASLSFVHDAAAAAAAAASHSYSLQKEQNNRAAAYALQVLAVLALLAERETPSAFFHFDGQGGALLSAPIERFPTLKAGYTFAAWIRVQHFASDESGLFAFVDGERRVVFEIFYRTVYTRHRGVTRSLCMQTQTMGGAVERFVFDAHAFVECGGWHHVCLTHDRAGVALYVDGRLVQVCQSFTFPRDATRHYRELRASIGTREHCFGDLDAAAAHNAASEANDDKFVASNAGGAAMGGTMTGAGAGRGDGGVGIGVGDEGGGGGGGAGVDAQHGGAAADASGASVPSGFLYGDIGRILFCEGAWSAKYRNKTERIV